MIVKLAFHPDAVKDLDDLRALHAPVVHKVLATLQELKSDPALLEILLEPGYGADRDEQINVEKWQSQWQRGRDLWRLKIWQLEEAGVRYRVIYAYRPAALTFYVLAVRPRSHIDYDDQDNPLTQRILRAYRGL